MTTLKQNKFYNLRDYVEAIDSVLVRWSACTLATKEEIEAKRTNEFWVGLSAPTLDYLEINLLNETEKIYKRIAKIEEHFEHRLGKEKNIDFNNKNFKG